MSNIFKTDIFKRAQTKYTGVFDFKDVYYYARHWLESRKYEITEKKYDKRKRSDGTEYRIIWSASKGIGDRAAFDLELIFNLKGVHDIKVESDGEKTEMQEGEFNLKVSAILGIDYDVKWEDKPTFKFLKGFYEKYVYKDKMEGLKSELWDEGWEFINELKAHLHLFKFLEPIKTK